MGEVAVKVGSASDAMRVSAEVSELRDNYKKRKEVGLNFSQQLEWREVSTLGGLYEQGVLSESGKLWLEQEPYMGAYTNNIGTVMPEPYGLVFIEQVTYPSSPYVYNADDRGVTVTGTNGGIIAIFEGTTGTYDVVLTSQPHADVTVNIKVSHASYVHANSQQKQSGEDVLQDLSADLTSLIFTSETWDTKQTVTLTAELPVQDKVEGEEDFVVSHSVTSGDVRYNTRPCSPHTFQGGALLVDDVTVVVMEGSSPSPTNAPTDAPTAEYYKAEP